MPGILILSHVYFQLLGNSGTDSKEYLNPECNSCQYSMLNKKAVSLPKDVFEKIALEKRKRLEAGNTLLSFRALTASLIIKSLLCTVIAHLCL